MKKEDYLYLKENVEAALEMAGLSLSEEKSRYLKAGLSEKRFRWDLLRFAGIQPGRSVGTPTDWNVYNYLDDSHIDTALRKLTKT